MDVLLSKFQVIDVDDLRDDFVGEKNWDFDRLEQIDFEKQFDDLAGKKSNLISNIKNLDGILARTKIFDDYLELDSVTYLKNIGFSGENDAEAVDLSRIITPKEIEEILRDQISSEWLNLASKILTDEASDSLIQNILKNIILEKCKKILILTIKTLKTKETQLQALHKKLLPISGITKIIYKYEPKQYTQFLELYIGCIHWYYKFYISVYTRALLNCKIETVSTVQEQATSYFSKFLPASTTDLLTMNDYDKYEDHANLKERLSNFQITIDHVVPLQIIESSNVEFKIEDIIKNFALLLQENYINEMHFIKTFFKLEENTEEVNTDVEVFDDRFLFVKCKNLFKTFIDSIETDYLGILISIRLIQIYIEQLDEGCDLQNFWLELVQLQLWPKFQRITSMRIYQIDYLKNCDILKFYDFIKNLLFVDLYLNQKIIYGTLLWNTEPIYQSFINALNLFENINKNLKNDKGKQHWKILVFNLLDELDMELRSRNITLKEGNIISELRLRYDI